MPDDIEHVKDRIKHWKAEIEKLEAKLKELGDVTDETGTSLTTAIAVREGYQLKIGDAKAYLHANQRQLVNLDPDRSDEETCSLLQESEWERK